MSIVEFQRKISQAQLKETIGNLNRAYSNAGDGSTSGHPNGSVVGSGGGGGGGGGGSANDQTINADIFDRRSIESRISYKSDNILRSTANYCAKYYKPTPSCMKSFFFKRFPFFSWIISYDIKSDFLKDLVAGLTLGIVHIPQGMAYALMAGVPAINGLYVSFFNVILYVLFGTSRHLSTGTYAIVSLMVISSLNKYNGILYPAQADAHGGGIANKTAGGIVHAAAHAAAHASASGAVGYLSNDPVEAKILIAGTLALLVGIIQILFAIFHFGVVTKYLSDSIVNGFTTGAAFHVVVSQIPTLLGIKLGEMHLPVVLIGEFIEIFKNISKTNLATLIISLISMVFLYIVKVHINEKFKEKLPVPIPVELILVIVATVVSYFVNFSGRYNVKTIGFLPLGIPKPTLPPLKVVPILIGDSVAIAIVSFAINVSMAKLFAKKHKYEIRPNQELFAYGIGNFVSAFFRGFPACVGLSRCAIMDSVGGRTQVNGIFSSILILIVLFVLAPLFKTLPNACLGAIIVIALKAMVLEVKIFPIILKRNKLEAMAWLATYLGVMILDVDVGLYIGVAFSLLLIIFQSQRARTSILGNVPGTSIYESIDDCEQAREFKTIKIIRYEESIYYANVDNFKYKIIKFAGVNPTTIIEKIREEKEKRDKLMKKLHNIGFNNDSVENQGDPEKNILSKISLKNIIIDCSCVNYIDSQGVNAILQLSDNYREIGITLSLTYCKLSVVRSFRKQSFKDKFDFNLIFPTTDDAVRHILKAEKDSEDGDKSKVHMIGNKMVVDIDETIEEEEEVYPSGVYKDENDAPATYYDDEYDTYVCRF